MAKISTLGLYNLDPTIFNGLQIPAGMDRSTVIQKICLDTVELEVLYPEPATLQAAITLWSAINLPLWQRMYNVLTAEYNPLWNVDATIVDDMERENETQNSGALTTKETGTISDERDIEKHNTGTQTNAGSKSNTGTVGDSGRKTNTGTVGDSGSKTNTGTVGDSGTKTNTGTQTHDITIDEDDTASVAGYNSNTMQQTTANTHDGDNQDKRTDNLTETTANTRTDNLTETTRNTRTDNLTETTNNTRTDNLTETNTNTRTDDLLEETDYTRTDNLTETTDDDNTRTFNKTTTETDTRGTQGSGSESRTQRRTGNIGVTASQDLVMKELEVAKVSIYRTIIESYKKEFCICIY